jgi:phosphatidylserine decarboxylase
MKLTSEAFGSAATFIRNHARPLEQALFAFHFETGSREAVLGELAKFQHPGGGFGRALEPDCRMPDPSPLASTLGFQILREVDTPADHPLVVKGIAYFLAAFDRDVHRWHRTLPAMNGSARAPWWTHTPESKVEKEFRANPGAEILGHLWHYNTHVGRAFLSGQTEVALNHLEELPAAMDMHDLLCYIGLLESDNLPDAERIQIGLKVLEAGPEVVTRDPGSWSSYCVKPLWLAPTPEAALFEDMQDDVSANLDYEIAHQNENGAWHPFWSWGSEYQAEWEIACREWQGILTLKTLRSLKAYNRL